MANVNDFLLIFVIVMNGKKSFAIVQEFNGIII